MGAYEMAVQYYVRAANVLHHYREMDSFKGQVVVEFRWIVPRILIVRCSASIYGECQEIVTALQDTLEARADDPAHNQRQVVETYGLLLQLTGNAEALAER